MPTNDREVFQHLTGDPNHSDVSNFLTYAQFAFDRREWFAHRTREDGREPTEEMVAAWTMNHTPHSFEQLRLRAQSFFDYAARDYMQDEIEAARQEALQSGVLREVASATKAQELGLKATLEQVKSAGALWRQAAIALLTAILAPIIIGGILALALLGEKAIPTIAGVKDAVSRQAAPPDAAKPDGQR
ncbi:hypothetical protein HNR00_003767 [Methylorubrum rhodinum]|uniref:Uncharacterized protein n=1 Tax=Methylorubrum rhodinum TaxID=29428 RepID=A0A840ZLX3_9HYPH|nr:hypothetical protein [Methylorubrum rhodinum]MBB5759039.1 hypothetical protein [Methylorubrum rhodinum]